MFPGMNPRQVQSAMKRLGIKQVDIPAIEVVIKLEDKEIVIVDPEVTKVNMMGKDTYQIVGEAHEREKQTDEEEISDGDVETVVEQTGVSKEEAKEMLEKTKGDLAEAIIKLTKQ